MAKKKKSSMMPSSDGQFARMFQGSFEKSYPMTDYLGQGDYPDTLAAIDRDINATISGAKKQAAKRRF